MLRHIISRYWLLLPLLVLAVVLLDRVETPAVVATEDTIDMRDTQSDYYLSGFRSRRFGPDGQIEYMLTGETLAHYPIDDHSRITTPRLELRREDVLWFIESDTGRYDPAPNLFTLQGSVTLRRTFQGADEAISNSQPQTIVMTTDTLRIATESNIVETDEMVDLRAPTWNLQARGMRTEIDASRLMLLSEVVGRFEIPDKAQ